MNNMNNINKINNTSPNNNMSQPKDEDTDDEMDTH
jgi:hypothetical protein